MEMKELSKIIEGEFDYFIENDLVQYDEEFIWTYNLENVCDLFDRVDNIRLLDIHYFEIKEMLEDLLKEILINYDLKDWYYHFRYYEDILNKKLNNCCDNILNMLR